MASPRRSPPPPHLQTSIRALGSSSSLTSTTIIILLLLVLLPAELTVSNPDDEACLSNLYSSITDPSDQPWNWTKSTFSSPCNGLKSHLQGVTCNSGRVYKLSLPNLSLTGTISPYISNCTNLHDLDLSSNSLTGRIPPTLTSLLNLAVLNLSANRLSGQIPQEIGDCAYLNFIDLHSNRLTGPIPNSLGLLARLSWLDVSNNRLEGPIPVMLVNRSGHGGPRFNASSFAGNKGLYGYPLPPMKGRGLSVAEIVGIGLASGLLSLILSFTVVCVWLRMTKEKATIAGEEGKISDLMPDY